MTGKYDRRAHKKLKINTYMGGVIYKWLDPPVVSIGLPSQFTIQSLTRLYRKSG
jgi:hypothetical protein